MTFDEIGFLTLNFYEQFQLFESRNDYLGDFDKEIIYRLLEYLKQNVSNTDLTSFDEYKNDFDDLGGLGIFDEAYWLKDRDSDYEMKEYDFQFYHLHLNHTQEQSRWKIGLYLFVTYKDVAFEFFELDGLEIKIIEEFDEDKTRELAIGLNEETIKVYKEYREYFSA